MTSERYAARGLSSHGRNCRPESLLVAFCAAARWRPVWSCLAKGKIAAEHDQSRGRKLIRQFYQKWSVAVCSCAVGQNETVFTQILARICVRIRWAVEESSNLYSIWGGI